jgi:predicted transcriptional regulator
MSDVTCKIKDLTDVPTSAKIRYLSYVGKTRSEIAKILDIRYQHVRNVLTQECKKLDLTAEISDIESKIQDTDQLDLF